jgi:hypothetical protein
LTQIFGQNGAFLSLLQSVTHPPSKGLFTQATQDGSLGTVEQLGLENDLSIWLEPIHWHLLLLNDVRIVATSGGRAYHGNAAEQREHSEVEGTHVSVASLEGSKQGQKNAVPTRG